MNTKEAQQSINEIQYFFFQFTMRLQNDRTLAKKKSGILILKKMRHLKYVCNKYARYLKFFTKFLSSSGWIEPWKCCMHLKWMPLLVLMVYFSFFLRCCCAVFLKIVLWRCEFCSIFLVCVSFFISLFFSTYVCLFVLVTVDKMKKKNKMVRSS